VQFLADELLEEWEDDLDLPDEAELLNDPDVQERIQEMMAAHCEAWASEQLPALDGLTPLEAVQHRSGREKVAALVDQLARDGCWPSGLSSM
jgi:hypothetical protein